MNYGLVSAVAISNRMIVHFHDSMRVTVHGMEGMHTSCTGGCWWIRLMAGPESNNLLGEIQEGTSDL